jgi:hypothetical protein
MKTNFMKRYTVDVNSSKLDEIIGDFRNSDYVMSVHKIPQFKVDRHKNQRK